VQPIYWKQTQTFYERGSTRKNAADTSLLVIPLISLMTSWLIDRQSLINDLIVPHALRYAFSVVLKARICY